MKRKIKLTLNGFHGYVSRAVVVEIKRDPLWTGDKIEDYYSGASEFRGFISESAARKFSCGCSDCCCGEGMETEFPISRKDLEFKSVEICGNYPQNV